jgi:hypothetical protein
MRDELQERPAQPKMELDDAIHVTRTFLIGLRHPTGFSLSNQASGWQSGHPIIAKRSILLESFRCVEQDRKRKKVVPASSHQPSCQTSSSDFEYGTTAFQSNYITGGRSNRLCLIDVTELKKRFDGVHLRQSQSWSGSAHSAHGHAHTTRPAGVAIIMILS